MIKKIILLLVILLLSGCAITHKFGPYRGQIIDSETGEPITGAVVFLSFYTYAFWSPGGSVSSLVDVTETLTDAQGKFNIEYRAFIFHPGNLWETSPEVFIFKPGYAVYPKHPAAALGCSPIETCWASGEEEMTIKLPKLASKEARISNLDYTNYKHTNLPRDKDNKTVTLIDKERIYLGFQPLRTKPYLENDNK